MNRLGRVSNSSDGFHQLFDEAMGSWVDAAQAALRFTGALSGLLAHLPLEGGDELDALIASVRAFGDEHRRHHELMWSLLASVAAQDAALTAALRSMPAQGPTDRAHTGRTGPHGRCL